MNLMRTKRVYISQLKDESHTPEYGEEMQWHVPEVLA